MTVLFILFFIVGLLLLGYTLKIAYTRNLIHERLTQNVSVTPVNAFRYIPKKIFQVIRDKNDVHPVFRKNIEHIQRLNPDWDYTLYDDADIIQYLAEKFPPYILHVYRMINPAYGAAKADFFRYLLIYNEGGVYLDIKSGMRVALNHILKENDEYVLAHWGCEVSKEGSGSLLGEFQQWHIIARPKHPFMKAVIDTVVYNILHYNQEIDGIGKPGVLRVTGPFAYTKAILPILDNHPCRILESSDFIGLVYDNTDAMWNHENLFTKPHYSRVTAPIVFNSA